MKEESVSVSEGDRVAMVTVVRSGSLNRVDYVSKCHEEKCLKRGHLQPKCRQQEKIIIMRSSKMVWKSGTLIRHLFDFAKIRLIFSLIFDILTRFQTK